MNQKIKTFSLIVLITTSSFLNVQLSTAENHPSPQEVLYIKGVRFTDALLEKWITEYTRLHPEHSLALAGKDNKVPAIEVAPLWKQKAEGEVKEAVLVPFGRYAVLPIAGEENELVSELKKKKLNEKRLKELFFEKDLEDELDNPDAKKKYDAVVYSGSTSYSVSRSFAGHFGYETSRLKGKKILGDDLFLNHAVKKDAKGVTFNHLSYIFDLESRKLNEGLALLPLDVKKEYVEVLESADLDQTITLLENKNIDLIPVEQLGFVIPDKIQPEILSFLEWVLSEEGQQYLHPFGFIKLDQKNLTYQQKQLDVLKTKFLATK